jgi:hypothetical protein
LEVAEDWEQRFSHLRLPENFYSVSYKKRKQESASAKKSVVV